ncbi:MAG TPA: DUF1259 domain-containing protein [Bacteriovoracaceae bacterium]|nr:DUF1259 domain-containing protein [Bacteriovoracaceae bacterium]
MLKNNLYLKLTLLLCLNVSLSFAQMEGRKSSLNTSKIEELTGLKGSLDKTEDVFKVTFPRDDLKVKVGKVKLTSGLGLTSWTAFTKTGDQIMAMGDIVLTERQVNSVMDVALTNGLEVTALHNHFFLENPRIFFMHIGGMGKEEDVASAVGKVYAKVKETILKAPEYPNADIDPAKTKLTEEILVEVMGQAGEMKNGIYKISIARPTKMHGFVMGNAMGVNTWAAFSGTDKEALVIGDFAMYEDELQGVLKALRKQNIQVVAIHNHMTHETPRVVFLHYWGIGPAKVLAGGVRAALDTHSKSTIVK